jgi:hypothetical protein
MIARCDCTAELSIDCAADEATGMLRGTKTPIPSSCLRTVTRATGTTTETSNVTDRLDALLDAATAQVRRYVVVGEHELIAIALWIAHTYLYDVASATPYLNAYSPEPGSGKTTLLDVLSVMACRPFQVDNLSEAALFRLIDQEKPTLLIDEVDAIFGKRNSDSSERIRQVLNSGYRKGKRAIRCAGRNRDELATFDVFGPKATAGLNELPGTLATRSIPIAMKPPLPSDVYEDFDHEEASEALESLRVGFEEWANEDTRGVLSERRLKPDKLDGLDARANEIWRILFRIADLAGGEWPERARAAALALSGRERRHEDTSPGIKLLGHIRDVFVGDEMSCEALAGALNALPDAPSQHSPGLIEASVRRAFHDALDAVLAASVRDRLRCGNKWLAWTGISADARKSAMRRSLTKWIARCG